MTDAGQIQDLVFDVLTSVQSSASILPCWNVLILYYYYTLEPCFPLVVYEITLNFRLDTDF